jgi:hypothetical protein
LQVSLIDYVAADPVAIFVFNPTPLGIAIVIALTAVIAFAMWYSKRETEDII